MGDISSMGFPTKIEQVSYSNQLSVTDDNTISYSIISGSLHSGLSLSSSGLISGTTSALNETSSFTVRATDLAGNFTDKAFTLFSGGFIPITWLTAGGATYSITGNGTSTSSVYKTNNNSSWAHNVYNNSDLTAPFSFEFSAEAASNGTDDGNSYKMIGVGRTASVPNLSNEGYRAFYSLYPYRTDNLSWFDPTSDGSTGGPWTNGETFVISVYANGDVKAYRKNSGLVKEWSTAYTGAWRVGASIYSINAPKGGFANGRVRAGQVWNGTQYV